MKHKFLASRVRQGFALPTVLIASVIMLTILVSAVSSIGSASVAIDNQYYNQLAREAAESGQARALDCLKQSPTFTPSWTNTSPLKPNTDCTGTVIPGMSQFVLNSANIRTTFSVGPATTNASQATNFVATGSVTLVRASNQNSAWRTYTQTIGQDAHPVQQPILAGGAGWQNGGHFATIVTSSSRLMGFGDNTYGELTDTMSPTSMLYPTQYALPSGVTSVTKAKSSGQGASFMCILGNNGTIWCRGGGGGNTSAVVQTAPWQQMAFPSGVTSYTDFWTDGYGTDTLCALGNDQHGYCVGYDVAGEFGNGVVNQTYTLSQPQQFGSGLSLRKMAVASSQVCGITTNDALYCAGSNSYGQIGAATTGNYSTPQAWPLPLNRQVQDASITYHTMNSAPVVHVLMTDGTIWGAGNYAMGDLGNGTTSGSTGTSQTPVMFNSNDVRYQTGGTMFNPAGACAGAGSGCCVDNSSSGTTDNNKIQLWQCNGTAAQIWVYNQINSTTNGINPYHHITNMASGMCLTLLNGNVTSGNQVVLYHCSNATQQQWVRGTDSNGNQVFHPASNLNLCMDATGGGTTNGTVIEIYSCLNNNPQVYVTDSTATGGEQGGFYGWQDMITGTDAFCGVRGDHWSGLWCAGNNQWGQLMNYQNSSTHFYGTCTPYPNGSNIWNANIAWQDGGGAWHGDGIDPSMITDDWRQQFRSLMIIGKSGHVYGAGRNQYGKLGNGSLGDNTGSNDYQSCTTSVFQLPSGVTATNLSTRDEFTTYVLGNDGRVYAAGFNNSGQIGDGTTTNRLTPVMTKIPLQGLSY